MWQSISMRIKKFYKKTGRKLQFDAKEPVGFDKTKVECYNCHKTGHFARECRTKEDNRRRDGWNSGNKDGNRTGKKEESKQCSGSDTQVHSCSNECKESYANLKRLYDAQREQLSDASVEIKAYTQGLKKVEAQLVAHQQGQLLAKTVDNILNMSKGNGKRERNQLWKSMFKGTCRVQRINLADFQDLMMALLPLEEVKGDITGKGKIKSENQANLHAGQQESNQNTGTKDKIDAGDSEKEIGGTKKRMNKFFRLILQRLQRQEMEANGGSEALMKTLVTRNSELGYSGRAAMSISTASANERLSLSETTNSQKDDNEIPPLDGYSEVDTDGIFTIQLMLFLDLSISEKVYKVVKALYGCIKLPRAWYATDNPQQEMSIYWQERTLTWHAKSRPLWPTSTTDAEYVALLHMLLLGKFYDSKSIWQLFKSKKIAQVVRAWIKSKNSLVKHFEDMRLCRPSKEYLQVWFDPPRDESMSCLTTKGMHTIGAVCTRRFRESLRRVTDGAEAFLILTLFILCLDKVSTDHAKLVPLGKVCTAKETLEKNTAKGTKCKLEPLISLTDDLSLLSNMAALESCPKHNMIAYLEKTEGNVDFGSAKSKTINNVRHITAKVAGKVVSISEASIRTDLIFDDADGIDSLPNQAIFDAIPAVWDMKGI
ncbi:ribonuclease H-like domain-containing protein [Tanacetum coccineum]